MKYFLFAIFLFLTSVVMAQPVYIAFEHIDNSSGLPNPYVNQVLRDHNGLIWLATKSGLAWYDAKTVHTIAFTTDSLNPMRLNNRICYNLVEDQNGFIWVNLDNKLLRINPTRDDIRIVELQCNSAVVEGAGKLFVDSKNNLWSAYDKIRQFKITSDGSLEDGREFASTIYDQFNDFMEDDRGRILVCSELNGLIVIDLAANDYRQIQFDSAVNSTFVKTVLRCGYIDHQDNVWLGTYNEGLILLNPNLELVKRYSVNRLVPPDKNYVYTDMIRAIAQTNFDGGEPELWVGTYDAGLFLFDAERDLLRQFKHNDKDRNSLIYNNVRYLYDDGNACLWVATSNGLDRYDFNQQETAFYPLSVESETLLSNWVVSMLDDYNFSQNAIVWAGTAGNGLFKFNSLTGECTQVGSDLPRLNEVHSLNKMGKDKILLGLNYGLASYSTVTNKFNNYDWQDRSFAQRDLPNRVSAVLPLDSGVFLTNSIFSSVKKVDLINNRIDTMAWGSDSRALLMDNNDKIWLADARRVYRINSSSSQIDTIRNEENGQSFIDGVIYNIHLDSHHERVWVASFLGLGFIDINSLKVTPVLADDALLGATVYDVIQDKMGNYWVITNSHLVAINEKFEIVYNSKLSRMSNSYLGDYASMLLLPDGRIVVSSVGGVLVVDAAKCLETKIPAPETYLHAIVSGDYNFQYGERVDLHFNHSPLLLEFACLSYTHAASNTFYYRLKGLQENWISNDDNASLRFERLSPGEYTLEIVSVNANGIWDNTPLEIHIKVSYPFWQRWWFFVLILFATAIIFYVIYRYRLSQLNKLTLMRNNISRDLHDDLGATLSAINIATALINKQAENPSQIKRIVAGMRKDIAHASEALDDIVWSINPKNDDWKILIARMRRYAAEILENAGIRYVIDFAEDVPQTRLSLESRRDIYLIFKETINNAARHSGAKFVQIGFSKEHENWVLKIKDDGKGFDVESSSERNGLKNIKYRCERINATYELASSPDSGTSWIFRF